LIFISLLLETDAFISDFEALISLLSLKALIVSACDAASDSFLFFALASDKALSDTSDVSVFSLEVLMLFTFSESSAAYSDAKKVSIFTMFFRKPHLESASISLLSLRSVLAPELA